MEFYLSVLIFCLVSAITPGPNNIMLMTSGVNHGIRRSIPHYLGICLGFPAMVSAVGLGLGAVFANYPSVHQFVKVVGIGYLLFLAWKIGNAGNPGANPGLQDPLTFFQAAAFQWVNPKAWVISIGLVATFTSGENIQAQIAFIILAVFFVGVFTLGLWLMLGAALQKVIHRRKHLQYFNIAMALLLALSVLPIAFSELNPAV